jgi:cation diffusion facilitator CzcD-associated flavoprotein CzcO
MSTTLEPAIGNEAVTDYGAIIIGAGFGGLRMLYDLRERGITAKVLEAGTDVGGTWYWNRYPGARTDSESWVYCFSFSRELEQDWDWAERYPAQPEVLRYLQHVTDRFDLRKDMQFNTRVRSAIYDETTNAWTVTTEAGETFTSTYLITATGVLSLPVDPPFAGLDTFEGDWYLTARWPKEKVDFAGKRVGIIGTGATAVQAIPIVAEQAAHLTVFQRTPNYVIPARNHALDDAQRQDIKGRYESIWAKAHGHVFGFAMDPANRTRSDVTPEEQQQVLEAGWRTGGFQFLFETFDDLLVDDASNQAAAEFVRARIREIVKDPATAELLCPKGYPLGGKRPPLGHSYYEAFNRDNVELIDVRSNPIERITARGVLTGAKEYELDVLIFATGFDAATGTMMAMDIRGRNGQTIKDRWAGGPETYLGLTVDGFPNMFMISGPQAPFANIPVVIDNAARWIGRAISEIEDNELAALEPTAEAVESWCKQMDAILDATILRQGEDVNSWFLGANIPGKPHVVLFYFGGANAYFNEIHGAADRDYEGFVSTPRTG